MLIVSATLPIFVVIAIGYAAVRSGLVPKGAVEGIGRLVLYVTVPALIFQAMASTHFGAIANAPFLAAYGIGSLACFGILFVFFRLAFGNDVTASGLKAFGAALPNSIYIGYPLLIQLFEEPPLAAFAMALLVENLVIFPLALIVMDLGASGEAKQGTAALLKGIGGRLIRNPILIAIVAGSAVSVAGLQLPEAPARIIGMLADASPAIALFFVGGLLVGTNVRGTARSIAAVGIGKLVIHPLAVAACILLLPAFDRELQTAAILYAAAPMLAIFPIVGARYGLGPQSAGILLVTTVSSFVSIPVILWLLTRVWLAG